MAVLPLVIEPDERLHITSAPVKEITDELRTLAANMLETMMANKGIGLAAVQVGVHQRLIVMDLEWGGSRYDDDTPSDAESMKSGNPRVFINAEIIAESDELFTYQEGCLSFPDNYSDVDRPATVTVRFMDLEGKTHEEEMTGLLAVCIQHEIDHTNGIVFVDHISKLKRDMIIRKLKKQKKLGAFDNKLFPEGVPL